MRSMGSHGMTHDGGDERKSSVVRRSAVLRVKPEVRWAMILWLSFLW